MSFLSASLMIAAKDLRIYVRDRTAMVLGFLLPLVLIGVFGALMGSVGGGGGSAMPRVTLWVVDNSQSETSREFLAALRDSEMLRIRPDNTSEVSAEETAEIQEKVADGEASHVLVIGNDFGTAGQPFEESMRLIRDPGREMEDRLIRLGLMQAMFSVQDGSYWSTMLEKTFRDAGMPDVDIARMTKEANRLSSVISQWAESDSSEQTSSTTDENLAFSPFDFMTSGIDLQSEDVAPPNRPKKVTFQLAQSVSGTAVMMLMFGLSGAATLLLTERDDGTMARLLSASIPRSSILLGKVIFVVVLGQVQMLTMLAFGEIVFDIDAFRDPLTLAALSLAWTLAATCLGILIATAAKTTKQAESWSPLIVLPLAALGGCWFPLQLLELPWALEIASKMSVTYWAMSGFQNYLWNGSGLASDVIIRSIGIQFAFAVGMFMIALVLFRRNFLRG